MYRQAIYEGAKINQEESLIKVAKLITDNNLTQDVSEQLLDIIRLHMPAGVYVDHLQSRYKLLRDFRASWISNQVHV